MYRDYTVKIVPRSDETIVDKVRAIDENTAVDMVITRAISDGKMLDDEAESCSIISIKPDEGVFYNMIGAPC